LLQGQDSEVGKRLEDLAIAPAELLLTVALRDHQDLQQREDGADEATPSILCGLEEPTGWRSKLFMAFEVIDEDHRIDTIERRQVGGTLMRCRAFRGHFQESRSRSMAAAPP